MNKMYRTTVSDAVCKIGRMVLSSMKRMLILLPLMCLTAVWGNAQPKFASKAGKALFTLNAYDQQGHLLRQGTGFYVGAEGEAMVDYRVLKGAHKAVAMDADGKKAEVECVLGADDAYSVVRIRVQTKGNASLIPANSILPMKSEIYVLNLGTGKAPRYAQALVADTAMIQGKYAYYGLDTKVDETWVGAPVFDKAGVLVGMLHSQIGGRSYVLDVRYGKQLEIKPIQNGSEALALDNIHLPKALPATQEEALVYMYLKARTASNEEYMDMVNRYIQTYPKSAEGYLRRAAPLIDLKRFDEADSDMQQYLTLVEDKANGHYNVASLIFDKLRLQPEPAYEKWNADLVQQHLEQAQTQLASHSADEHRQADERKCQVLKAQVLMFQKRYDEAIGLYESLNQAEGGVPSYLYAISLAREGRGDSVAALIEPIDSAISMMGEPLPREASSYVIRRGHLKANAGKYREAVLDYNQYAYLLNGNVNATFYYERSQVEVNGRMYQQALTDIDKAIELSPREALYQVDKAALTIRVNMLDECIDACRRAIALDSSIVDSYRILGYALLQKGDKEGARLQLQKAIDMGDQGAQTLMDTYFK